MQKKINKPSLVVSSDVPDDISANILENIFALVMRKYANNVDYDISLAFVDYKTSKRLNKEYSHNDYATDVLSFEYSKDDTSAIIRQNVGGEVVICPEVAKKNALRYKIDLKSELALLFAHGLLHLNGFDHQTKKDQARFDSMQSDILDTLKLNYRRMIWSA